MSCWVKKKGSRGQDKDKKDCELLPCLFIPGSLGVAASTSTVQFYAQSVCGLLLHSAADKVTVQLAWVLD